MPLPINISASRGSAVLGLSDYRTQQDVFLDIMESREPGFAEKNGFIYEPFTGNAATRWGSAFEDSVVELAEGASNGIIGFREQFVSYKDKEFITCHIDGQYSGPSVLHEGKTTNAFTFSQKWGEPGTDHIPMDYMIQCQHQMMCTGADEVILSVLVFPKRVEDFEAEGWSIGGASIEFNEDGYQNNDAKSILVNPILKTYANSTEWARVFQQIGNFHQYPIKSNPALQAEMLKHYTDFWNNHILTGTPPDPKKYDDIKNYLNPPVGTVILSDESQRLSTAYKLCTAEIKELNRLKDHYKTQMLTEVINNKKTVDDGQQEKLIMMDDRGNKLHGYGKGGFR